MHDDTSYGQRGMAMILMAVTDSDIDESNQKAKRSVQLEGSAGVDPPLTTIPTTVTILTT